MSAKKLILVIGATGAQGFAVINALLASSPDGTPSPYAIRALTRDPSSTRAKDLTSKGVECVKGKMFLAKCESASLTVDEGSFDDLPSVEIAFQGVYGAWVNTDGFTVGEQKEIYAGLKIFEIAKSTSSVRHYVWSNLDYSTKVCDR